MNKVVCPLSCIALVMAFGLLGVVVVDTIIAIQEVQAQSKVGQCASALKNSGARTCHNLR
jgi:hypothetical protein